jgi:hypothetical protein
MRKDRVERIEFIKDAISKNILYFNLEERKEFTKMLKGRCVGLDEIIKHQEKAKIESGNIEIDSI